MSKAAGCVYRRGTLYWVKVELDRDPSTGQRRYHYRGGFRNKKEAEAYRAQILNELYKGSFVEPAKMTVGEFLERWLRDYAEVSVRPSTLESYRALIRRHLIPALGAIPLAKLQPIHLQEMLARKRQEGLSPRSVRYLYSLMREALGHAVKWQLVGRNVAEAVDPPRMERPEQRVLTEEQASVLLERTEDLRLLAAIALGLLGGLRRGEVLGLKWEDVDPKAGRIHVRQALEYVPGKGLILTQPKTATSRRTVDLPPLAFEILARWRKQQATEELACPPELRRESGLVITSPTGGPVDPDWLTEAFRRQVRKVGLPPVTFHGLRHTSATLLIKNGEPISTVSERLGHSSRAVTVNIYTHVLPGAQKEAALRLERIFRTAPGRYA